MIPIILTASIIASTPESHGWCADADFCVYDYAYHILIDDKTKTITAYNDTIMIGVQTDYCLVIVPNAHPTIQDSKFGTACNPSP